MQIYEIGRFRWHFRVISVLIGVLWEALRKHHIVFFKKIIMKQTQRALCFLTGGPRLQCQLPLWMVRSAMCQFSNTMKLSEVQAWHKLFYLLIHSIKIWDQLLYAKHCAGCLGHKDESGPFSDIEDLRSSKRECVCWAQWNQCYNMGDSASDAKTQQKERCINTTG